jgi:TonB family protein
VARALFWGVLLGFLAVSSISMAAPAANECPPIQIRPITSTHTIPPYPPLSQKIGEQGPTQLMVDIDTAGVPTHIDVVKSSGSLRLDDAAVAHVMQYWRWEPATQNCKPVNVRTDVSIVWNLQQPQLPPEFAANLVNEIPASESDFPPGARQKGEGGESVVIVLLGSDGKVAKMGLIYGTGYPDLDEAALEIVKKLQIMPVQLMGKAAKSTAMIGIRWSGTPSAPPPTAFPQR